MHPNLKETALMLAGLPAIVMFTVVSIPLSMPIVGCILLALGVAK